MLSLWHGIVVYGVHCMNKVNPRWTRLIPGWVTIFGQVYHLGKNQPTRLTQPCIPLGSLV